MSRIEIQIPEELDEAVRNEASLQGMTISDWIRCIIREALGIKISKKKGSK